jgi:PKD repeat protein
MLRIDGAQVGQTTATQMVPPAPLANGRHSYQLSATNRAGVTTNSPVATVFVDTVAPRARWKLSGTAIVNTHEQLRINYSDPPPAGLPRSAASGVTTVYVNWGDRSARERIRRTTASHVYARIRTYTITITVIDRAGNRTVIVHKVKIKAKPKPKKHKKHKKAGRKR